MSQARGAMSVTLKHPDALVHVEKLKSGKNRILVEMLDQTSFVSKYEWETWYSLELIEKILEIQKPSHLCDEIMRDEDNTYVQDYLKYAILSYAREEDFHNKTIMDFGCGCGASTMILGRMFPNSNIIGVDLYDKYVQVARLRAEFYCFDRMRFLISPKADSLPHEIEEFDYALFNGVYEHLLPNERDALLLRIWSHLKSNGILFINETPFRYFPIESHTTRMPLINYFPDKITLYLSRRFSKRVRSDEAWETLLRRGIRGGSVKEIIGILNKSSPKPLLLKPKSFRNSSEIYYKAASARKLSIINKFLVLIMKEFARISGLPLSPYISIAIRKIT